VSALDRLFRKRVEEEIPEIELALLRSDRFRLEREHEWKRLEAIVRRMEAGRLRKVPDEDLLDLAALYRTAASSLAIARETSLDAATLAYLEALVQRAWFQVYGPRSSLVTWLRRFFGGGWSAAVRAIWLDICIAFAVTVAGAVVGWLLVARDSDWYYALVPAGMADARVPGASREALQQTLAGADQGNGLTTFAASLFSHNAGIAILAFALGFAFGIPSLMLLIANAAELGAMMWLFQHAGLGNQFAAWLSIHGSTEMFAIVLAGAAGLHIGRSMAFPGTRPVLTAAAESGLRAAQVMAGVVLMLVFAAMLEAYGRQLVASTLSRSIIGSFMLVFWLAYFFAFRRRGEGRPV
jgi:uncharacterized membrane protein SpoIIM required for sporulation